MSPRNATEIGQRRFYEFKGERYPSVTTILKAWPMEWGISYGAKASSERALSNLGGLVNMALEDREHALKWLKAAPHEKRDAAAGSGTEAHEFLEGRVKGETHYGDLSPTEKAIDDFLLAYRPDVLYSEAQVFSVTDKWAGSCDLFANIYGRTLAIDLKTSPIAPTDHKARLQLAAYAHGDFIAADDREIAPVPTCDGAAVLWVPRDNPRGWILIETPAGRDEYLVFLSVQRLWNFYDKSKDEQIGEGLLMQAPEVSDDAA